MSNKRFDSIDDFLSEINAPPFMAGVNACVAHTKRTGYETSFKVLLHPRQGIIYPGRILVGDENSVGKNFLDYERFDQFSIETSGKSFAELTDKERKDLLLRVLLDKKKGFSIPFPKSRLNYNPLTQLDVEEEIYDTITKPATLIGFHTHPYDTDVKKVAPSAQDLRSLNASRQDNESDATQVINPIEVILNVNTKNHKQTEYPVIIVQEKTFTPHMDNIRFDILEQQIIKFGTNLMHNTHQGTYSKTRGFRIHPDTTLPSYFLAYALLNQESSMI